MKTLLERNLARTDLTALITEWINSTYLDLVTRSKFPEIGRNAPIPVPPLDTTTTWVTVSGTPNYSMGSNALFPISLRDTTNDQPLRQKSIRWYDRNKSTTPGKPERYAIFSSEYWLDPEPDGAYTVQERYRRKVSLPAMSADADVPIIGEEWHEAIVLGASYRGAQSLSYPDAGKWFADYKQSMTGHSEQHTEEDADGNYGFTIKM